jgi:threonine/homoserine/homoserine lactone efflux protein
MFDISVLPIFILAVLILAVTPGQDLALIIPSLLNPKVIIFIFAFLLQFADSGRGNLSSQILLLGILMKLSVFIVEASVAFASGYAREWFVANPTRQTKLQYLTGIVLCLLGVSIFFAR